MSDNETNADLTAEARRQGTYEVTQEVLAERMRQDRKWGEQNHPDFFCGAECATSTAGLYGLEGSGRARERCDMVAASGDLNWGHILLEEVNEAFDAPTEAHLREELVQVAAVAVAWIEAIDRRNAQ